jgi:hypothetical protein
MHASISLVAKYGLAIQAGSPYTMSQHLNDSVGGIASSESKILC